MLGGITSATATIEFFFGVANGVAAKAAPVSVSSLTSGATSRAAPAAHSKTAPPAVSISGCAADPAAEMDDSVSALDFRCSAQVGMAATGSAAVATIVPAAEPAAVCTETA